VNNAFLLQLFSAVAGLASFLVPITAHAAPGDLYETDAGSGTVFKFTPSGVKTTFASGLPAPAGVAFDSSGNLFVADNTGNGEIFKFTPSGTKTTFASGLTPEGGLAFDGSGNLLETDPETIFKFSPSGTKSTFASSLVSPTGLAFDRSGNLFVTDVNEGTILKFTPSGVKTTFASGLSQPDGLAFDDSGDLFVAVYDSVADNGTILKFTPNGVKSTFASGLPQPFGLAFDDSGNLFVAATITIFKFTPSGTRSTFASGLSTAFGLAFEPPAQKVRNISTRGLVGTGGNVLIGGFILGGNSVATNAVLVRALGPTLTGFGVTGALQDPTLELHNAAGALLMSNNNWKDTQQSQIQATGLAPPNDHESAIYAVLPAGNFTAIVSGVGNTTGVALVEVYSLP
jgi:sugar lactone lactonase YvrE